MTTRILVVDNNEQARQRFVAQLSAGLGETVYQVADYPYTAFDLAALVQLHPDLLILDFNIQHDSTGWRSK